MTARDRSTNTSPESPVKKSGDVAYPFPAGAAERYAASRKPGAKISAPVQSLVDQLGELRALIKRATAEEKAMTAEVLAAIPPGQTELRGERFTATKGSRENLTVDPGLFIEAVGLTKALAAIAVRVEPARALLSGSDLEAISEKSAVPVLYVKERPMLRRVEARQ